MKKYYVKGYYKTVCSGNDRTYLRKKVEEIIWDNLLFDTKEDAIKFCEEKSKTNMRVYVNFEIMEVE